MTGPEGFFAMGGYGAFVWPAYGVTALVMIWLLVASLARLRRLERKLSEAQLPPPGSSARRGTAGTPGGEEATP
jgi:heme exporter protein D